MAGENQQRIAAQWAVEQPVASSSLGGKSRDREIGVKCRMLQAAAKNVSAMRLAAARKMQ